MAGKGLDGLAICIGGGLMGDIKAAVPAGGCR